MKKVYIAKNMIINSRLVRLYENSPQEKKEYMMRRVGELITEYKSFQYPPLYGYLCNIFCSVAVCEYDEEHGMTRDRAIEEVRTAMEDFMRPSREKYEKIFGISQLYYNIFGLFAPFYFCAIIAFLLQVLVLRSLSYDNVNFA